MIGKGTIKLEHDFTFIDDNSNPRRVTVLNLAHIVICICHVTVKIPVLNLLQGHLQLLERVIQTIIVSVSLTDFIMHMFEDISFMKRSTYVYILKFIQSAMNLCMNIPLDITYLNAAYSPYYNCSSYCEG